MSSPELVAPSAFEIRCAGMAQSGRPNERGLNESFRNPSRGAGRVRASSRGVPFMGEFFHTAAFVLMAVTVVGGAIASLVLG